MSKRSAPVSIEVLEHSSSRKAPPVGYVATGFKPVEGASFSLYAHTDQLAVVGRGEGVDYVTSEAPTTSGRGHNLAIGVFDKAKGTLTLAPVPNNRLLRIEPRAQGKEETKEGYQARISLNKNHMFTAQVSIIRPSTPSRATISRTGV